MFMELRNQPYAPKGEQEEIKRYVTNNHYYAKHTSNGFHCAVRYALIVVWKGPRFTILSIEEIELLIHDYIPEIVGMQVRLRKPSEELQRQLTHFKYLAPKFHLAGPKLEGKKMFERRSVWQLEVSFSQMKEGMEVPLL
jgi:hypothetical protein